MKIDTKWRPLSAVGTLQHNESVLVAHLPEDESGSYLLPGIYNWTPATRQLTHEDTGKPFDHLQPHYYFLRETDLLMPLENRSVAHPHELKWHPIDQPCLFPGDMEPGQSGFHSAKLLFRNQQGCIAPGHFWADDIVLDEPNKIATFNPVEWRMA